MGTRAVAVGAAPGAAGVSGEAGLAGVPRLLEDLARLSEDKDTADIVFLLGRDETPVYAHRIILQARSVFSDSNCFSRIEAFLHSLNQFTNAHAERKGLTMRQSSLPFTTPVSFSVSGGARRIDAKRVSRARNFIKRTDLTHPGIQLIVNHNFY